MIKTISSGQSSCLINLKSFFQDFSLPNECVSFCQPDGCKVIQMKKGRNKEVTSFAFTLTDKDSGKLSHFQNKLSFYLVWIHKKNRLLHSVARRSGDELHLIIYYVCVNSRNHSLWSELQFLSTFKGRICFSKTSSIWTSWSWKWSKQSSLDNQDELRFGIF